MWGVLDNGNPFIIRSALEGIHDSVKISNRFMVYVGVAVNRAQRTHYLVGQQKITDPILRLASISKGCPIWILMQNIPEKTKMRLDCWAIT